MPRSGRTYDTSTIHSFLDRVLVDIGPDNFSGMKLLELEKLVRTYDSNNQLPAKTVLRAAIHSFRVARWPSTAPKRTADRFRRY